MFVGDVKYKRTNVAGVLHPDIDQALAYTVATDLSGALLIYAAGEAEQVQYRIVHLGKTVEVIAMNLDGPPSAVLADVRRIADRVRSWRQGAPAAAASTSGSPVPPLTTSTAGR